MGQSRGELFFANGFQQITHCLRIESLHGVFIECGCEDDRRRLLQDTVVVLITTFLMTMFLLVVDLFWGWLLSQSWVGVLPAKATGQEKGNQVQEAKW